MKQRPSDLVTATEARALLGVSFPKLSAMLKDGTLKSYDDPLDKRRKLISRADLQALKAQSLKAA